jgi:hypothetical protein
MLPTGGLRGIAAALSVTEPDHPKQQRFLKTRYQNWPTETEAQNGAFVLSFETRRQRNTPQRPRIRGPFHTKSEMYEKIRTGWLGGRDSNLDFAPNMSLINRQNSVSWLAETLSNFHCEFRRLA